MQAIWPGLDGVGHACLAPPDAGIVRGELTNWAQPGTRGAEATGQAAAPDTAPGLGAAVAAVAAVAGRVAAPVTATIASPADAPIRRANTGNTGPRLDRPALRMNPPQARLFRRTGKPLKPRQSARITVK
jgi:hypothetical protein